LMMRTLLSFVTFFLLPCVVVAAEPSKKLSQQEKMEQVLHSFHTSLATTGNTLDTVYETWKAVNKRSAQTKANKARMNAIETSLKTTQEQFINLVREAENPKINMKKLRDMIDALVTIQEIVRTAEQTLQVQSEQSKKI